MPVLHKAVTVTCNPIEVEMRYIIYVLTVIFFASVNEGFGCTCVGKNEQTLESEVSFSDLVAKGKVVGVSEFDYLDSTKFYTSGTVIDTSLLSYATERRLLYKIILDRKFKAAQGVSDTIYVVTGRGGGDCGFEFKVGETYIVYADNWVRRSIVRYQKRKKTKSRVREEIVPNWFQTDICRRTQQQNSQEIQNLERHFN
jgi:hypothetical protein